MTGRGTVTVIPVEGIGEIHPGDDIGRLIAAICGADLIDGDVLVVTSKIVSKAEGRSVRAPKPELLDQETVQVVARRGTLSIVRNRLGLVMAGAGIDGSNTEPGTSLLLPLDPDASARGIRTTLQERTGCQLGVVVSDTAGRAWRQGQTDIAIGAAGILLSDHHAGRQDPYGNVLAVTEPAVADELAAAADLVKGKLSRCPVAIVRGLPMLVTTEDGPGAAALIRPQREDLFGFGARLAVLTAVGLQAGSRDAFGEPEPAESLGDLLSALSGPDGHVTVESEDSSLSITISTSSPVATGRLTARVEAVATACGWWTEWDHVAAGAAVGRVGRP